MGILDEAIKEHLELKRRHGAGDSELKQLEDEAFGPPERPGGGEGEAAAEAPTELVAQPDLAEAEGPEAAEGPPHRRARPDIADLQEAPPPEPEVPQPEQEAPQAEPEAPVEPSTEERQAIADQPTELYEIGEEPAGSEPRAPSEEELIEEEIGEPRLAPVDPLDAAGEEGGAGGEPEEEEDFFDEQRLSEELDQALEAPEEELEEEGFEPGEPAAREPDEDLLEETPDFLEEAPEDDRLWFEQKPPKDFDFDD